jgi:hypothetical protein
MKTVAFAMALFIMAFGAVGIFLPSVPTWVAQHSVTAGAFYVVAAIRVAFGLVLISAASASRAPKTLRVLGYIILIAGITTALMGLLAIERARAMIEWWLQQGPTVLRLTSAVLFGFGGFIAYVCAPRRAA